MKHFIFLVVIVAVIVSGCAAAGPCATDKVQASSKQLLNLINQWQDAYNIARSTSRIGLAAPVQSLQALRREVEALEVPPCLTAARGYLVQHMNRIVDGFLSFMAQQDDAVVQAKFDQADAALTQYTDEMNRIAACAPNCPEAK